MFPEAHHIYSTSHLPVIITSESNEYPLLYKWHLQRHFPASNFWVVIQMWLSLTFEFFIKRCYWNTCKKLNNDAPLCKINCRFKHGFQKGPMCRGKATNELWGNHIIWNAFHITLWLKPLMGAKSLHKRPPMRTLILTFDVGLNHLLTKESSGQWFETPRCLSDTALMIRLLVGFNSFCW